MGGNVSQGILKALALSQLHCRVVGACISPLAPGLYTVDRAYVSPRADAPDFLEWLLGVCREEKIDAVLSGVEPVLTMLAREAAIIREQCGAVAVVSEPSVLAIGGDKLRTSQWLQEQGVNFARSAGADDTVALEVLVGEFGFPLLAKPREGKSGTGIVVVRNENDLAWIRTRTGYVVQEYLGDDETEYTVGCFSDREGQVRGALAMRRELQEGTTVRAEVGEFPAVRDEAIRIAQKLLPLGPCNIQMRLHQGRAVCFEINVRFSGTTPMRARFGFNEVEAALRHYVLGEPAVDLPLVTSGIAVRYWNEMYIDQAAARTLTAECRLDQPQAHALTVESYGIRCES